jgi:hypothetical protein
MNMTQDNRTDGTTNKSSREMEAAIGETRVALSEDIKALSDKASPAHVKHEIKQALKTSKDAAIDRALETAAEVKDAAVDAKNVVVDKALEVKDVVADKAGEVKDVVVEAAHNAAVTVSETVDEVGYQTRRVGSAAWKFTRANAVPLALLGIGAGWLITNQRKGSSQADAFSAPEWEYDDELGDESIYASAQPYPAGGRRVREDDAMDRVELSGVRRAGHAEPRAALRRPRREAHSAGANLQRKTRAVYDKAGEKLEEAEHSLVEGMSRSRDFVRDRLVLARDASLDFADANPLALAFGTLVAGIGIGLMLPSTKREDELLAPSRDRLKRALGTARDAAQDVGRIAKQTAGETLAGFEGNR